MPDVDPWSREGVALARFEQLKEAAMGAAEAERNALGAKKSIRSAALAKGNDAELGDAPQELLDELQRLTKMALDAKERKLAASEKAQQARVEFDALMRSRPIDAPSVEA